jgi:hypothetical protein
MSVCTDYCNSGLVTHLLLIECPFKSWVSWTFFHVPFFCTAAVTEILYDFVCKYWVSWAPKSWFWTKFSFRQNIISRVLKLPESTRRKQAIFNIGSLFYSHCGVGDMAHSVVKGGVIIYISIYDDTCGEWRQSYCRLLSWQNMCISYAAEL